MSRFNFTESFKQTIAEFESLPEGNKADYFRSQKKGRPMTDTPSKCNAAPKPDPTAPMRCAECDCKNGGADCTWFAPKPRSNAISPVVTMGSGGPDNTSEAMDLTAEERHADKVRNLIINHALTDLEGIINSHDPDVDVPIDQGIWDRLDKMAMLIEAREAAKLEVERQACGRERRLFEKMEEQFAAQKARAEAAEAQRDALDAVLSARVGCTDLAIIKAKSGLEAAKAELVRVKKQHDLIAGDKINLRLELSSVQAERDAALGVLQEAHDAMESGCDSDAWAALRDAIADRQKGGEG